MTMGPSRALGRHPDGLHERAQACSPTLRLPGLPCLVALRLWRRLVFAGLEVHPGMRMTIPAGLCKLGQNVHRMTRAEPQLVNA